ncbi:MAG: ATP synthase F1 subunit epsilon [Cytophagales bacterium]|nr:ATP synthase F1 subunit epsilon [Cytophagales bacterium]
MDLKVLTPEKTLFQGEVSSVTVPCVDGYLQILPHHADLVGRLKSGILSYHQVGEAEEAVEYAVSSGFVEVRKNTVVILLPA